MATLPLAPRPHKGETAHCGTLHPLIKDEIIFQCADGSNKFIVAHKLKYDDGFFEIRICYWIEGTKPRSIGRWMWGQYAPMLRPDDLKRLINEMEERTKGGEWWI
jgi:hypothetical protein